MARASFPGGIVDMKTAMHRDGIALACKRSCMSAALRKMCPGRGSMREMGPTKKQFVGSVSVHRQQGMVVLRAGATRVLFGGSTSGTVKGFIGTGKMMCRIMNLFASGKDFRPGTFVPFAALRLVCGGNSGLGGLVFVARKLSARRGGRVFRGRCHGTVNMRRQFATSSGNTV